MTDLIRIVYISRATFATSNPADGVEPTVSRILSTSRTNNRKHGLVGMLYYGDGCFFQCLEGETSKVQTLYKTLLKDSRHKDLKILASEPIKRLSFPDWSMKYVPVDQHMRKLLEEHGFEQFDPYRFDHHLVERVMQLLQGVPDPTIPPVEGRASPPARTLLAPCFAAQPDAPPSANGSAKLSLAISIAALVISVIALLLVLSRL
ncbi:BLUF domain-containing protein [Halopseudomonas pelagia]|uniref:Blue light sensor protein n=1 Tax=Halopseudomonas pelagia TaxID=553151 RepID=A0AA91TYW6_9GAMM|nr:BLUF domain-containing protein [Halopseudomonas pelagia]PCC97524.1 blue light sensor protein [Halopseudomonas pelagia]QFY57839.1 blue light sensor protein [Halopseudomonas pelagia]